MPKRPLQAAKPPVLNLKATEVKSRDNIQDSAPVKPSVNSDDQKSEKPEKPPVKSAPTAADKKPAQKPTKNTTGKTSSKRNLVLVSLAALIAAGLGGAWAFKTYGSKYFANPDAATSAQLAQAVLRIDKLENSASQAGARSAEKIAGLVESLKGQISKNEAALSANSAKLANLQKTASEIRVALAKAVEADKGPVAVANELQFRQLSEKLGLLEQNITTLKIAGENAADENAGDVKIENMQTRFDALAIRLGAAEEQNQALSKSIGIIKNTQEKLADAPGTSPASELAKAFTILRVKITQGEPFEKALDGIASALPQEIAIDVLRPFAKTGAPTIKSLQTALANASSQEKADGDQAGGAGEGSADTVLKAITSRFTGLVKVTKIGETNWTDQKKKALEALANGQLGAAIESLGKGKEMPENIKTWLVLAKQKADVDDAVVRLTQTIMAELTAGTN